MILDVIVEDKKKRLPEHKKNISEEKMKELALSSTRKSISFYDALKKDGLSIIGEFKKASPSHGTMDNKIELDERIRQYSSSADAISCLTEEDHFNGSTEYLKQIRSMTDLPIIRKDFIIDEYQVYEAKVIGADAILLIAAILDDNKFKKLYDLAYSLGLDVLCEVHDEEEMKRMLALDVKIIGINNRNLKTFEVNLDTTKKLCDMVTPQMRVAGKVLVSESGVSDTDDIKVLAKSHADALLIGTVLMEAVKPQELIAEFKGVYDNEYDKTELIDQNGLTEVKICGITSMVDVNLLIKYGADYGGMVVFYPKSKRDVTIEEAGRMVEILKKSDMTLDDIDYIVCHQANERIINHVKKKYPGHEDKFYINIAEYGNTSAASIPIALDELAQSGCFDKGRKLILAGFGAGLSWSSALIET